MRTIPFTVSLGFALLLVAFSSALAGEPAPEPTAFQSKVAEISADRAGFIAALAEKWAGADERAVTALADKLGEIPLHELVAASLAQSEGELLAAAGIGPDAAAEDLAAVQVTAGGIAPLGFPPEFDTKLEYTAVEPCRVMDTRNWNNTNPKSPLPVPGAHAVEVHMSDRFGDIPQQGGDTAGCPNLPNDAAAYAVTLGAIAPSFPSSFPGFGFATLLPYDGTDWSFDFSVTQPPAPAANRFSTYDPGTFSQASTITWDGQQTLISNTTIVAACDGCGWHTWLYTGGKAHFTVDVVGYFDETVPCDAGDLFHAGLCYETSLRTATSFSNAVQTCAGNDGRLASISELWPMGSWSLGKLTLACCGEFDFEWVDDLFWDFGGSPVTVAFVVNDGGNLTRTAIGNANPYRCVYPAAD